MSQKQRDYEEEREQPEVTRREFLTGQWDPDRRQHNRLTSSDEPDSTEHPGGLLSGGQWSTLKIVTVLGAVVFSLVLAGTAAGAGGTLLASCADATAQTATTAQKQALTYSDQLRSLAASHPGLVPQQRLTGINQSLENGATELELSKYKQACGAFTNTAEQARGALRTYYPEATRATLNTAEQVIDHHGADDPARESALQSRHDRLADRLSTTSAVSDHARLYRQSEDLLADARELKPTLLERVLAALPLGVTALLCLSLAVLLVQYLLRDDDSPPEINQ